MKAVLFAIGLLALHAHVQGMPLRFHSGTEEEHPSTPLSDRTILSIKNHVISVAVDLSMGSAISEIVNLDKPVINLFNLINTHDEGRYVQLSFYSGPCPYHNASWNDHRWCWNPISAGSVTGHKTKIVAANRSKDGTEIYVKAIPLQWALHDTECNCSFETWITLPKDEPSAILVKNKLVTYRYDDRDFGPFSQELPAVYPVSAMSDLWTYNGTTPWMNASVSSIPYPHFTPQHPWANFKATEHWAAFTVPTRSADEPKYGLGVFNPRQTDFLGGLAGKPGQWGTKSGSTSYIAPTGKVDIKGRGVYEYSYVLSVGHLEDIRGVFDRMRHQM